MTEREYNALPGVRRSTLFHMAKSPAHYKWASENPTKDTPALLFGRAFHAAVLQPEEFTNGFAIMPAVDRRTKAGRELYDKIVAESAGKEMLSQDDYDRIIAMREAIKQSPAASMLIGGDRETCYQWTDADTGIMCKCRTDAEATLDKRYIVDIKTCTDASTKTFNRDAIKYGYDLQVGLYCEGVRAVTGEECGFIFIAIEKTPPYAINILQADEQMMMRGKDLFREYIGLVAECEKTGNWYAYNRTDGDLNTMALPGYIKEGL